MEFGSFHPGVLDYQRDSLLRLLSLGGLTSLRGKRVIEIGGNGDLAVSKTLYEWSGTRVTVVTPDPELHEDAMEEEKIVLVLRGAEDTGLADESVDVIYGSAVLEHVLEYRRMFAECFRLLRSGGHLLLQGGPHWHSRVGHHLFV